MLSFDDDSRMMEAPGQLLPEDQCLQSPLQQLFDVKRQDVIEPVLGLRVQEPVSEHLPEKRGSFELSSLVVLVEGQEFSGSLSKTGQGQLGPPEFSLVLEAILSADLDFLADSLLFEEFSGSCGCFCLVSVAFWHAAL